MQRGSSAAAGPLSRHRRPVAPRMHASACVQVSDVRVHSLRRHRHLLVRLGGVRRAHRYGGTAAAAASEERGAIWCTAPVGTARQLGPQARADPATAAGAVRLGQARCRVRAATCGRLPATRVCAAACAGASIVRTVHAVLADVLEKQPSASLLLHNYMKLCVIVDEIINEVRRGSVLGDKGAVAAQAPSHSVRGVTLFPGVPAGDTGDDRPRSDPESVEKQGAQRGAGCRAGLGCCQAWLFNWLVPWAPVLLLFCSCSATQAAWE